MATSEEIYAKVQETLVDALGVDDDEVTPEATLQGDLGAESIDFLDIVFRLEKNFNFKIPKGELFPENLVSGETSFVQVLVARRTYFDSNLQFIASQTQLAQARARVDGFVLTGALDPVGDNSGDDSLRGLTFSQQ